DMPITGQTGGSTEAGPRPSDGGTESIRTLRRAVGLTQGELGKHVGVTRQTIAAVEKGDYAPSVYLALRISRRLGSTVEALFPLDKEPS
ncbi:MAG: helix-turn-helix transcriptional regulator, partial [Brevibacterium yomogidense]